MPNHLQPSPGRTCEWGGMTTVESPPLVHEASSPLFSAHWLGRDPLDRRPRMVECFGPSASGGPVAIQPADLGLQPVLLGNPPPMTSVDGGLDGQQLVLRWQDQEFLRTEPLPLALLAALRRRPEILLLWVDVPLRDPRVELPMVGLQHLWTGVAGLGATLR